MTEISGSVPFSGISQSKQSFNKPSAGPAAENQALPGDFSDVSSNGSDNVGKLNSELGWNNQTLTTNQDAVLNFVYNLAEGTENSGDKGKPGEGKPGEGKPGEGKPGEGKPDESPIG